MKLLANLVGIVALLATIAIAQTDPKGDAKDPARDLVACEVSADRQSVIVTAEVAGDWDFDAIQILIDTQPNQGFAVGAIKADLMVEGATLYRYNGKGDDWTWQRIGEVRRTVANRKLTTHISRDHLRTDAAAFIIRTLTGDWQTVVDTAPDSAAIKLTLREPAGDAAEPAIADAARDITNFTATQEGDEVVFTIAARQGGALGTYLLFVDTDLDAKTGFQPPADPRFGFEMLISGDRLHRHNGATRDAWQWEGVGPAKVTTDDNRMTIRVQAGLFGAAEMGAAVWAMSEDWRTRVDLAPAEGLLRLKVDAKPVAPRPQVQMAEPKVNRHLPARQRVREAQSFYCYYGSGRVAELSHYDLVILHTPQMASEDVKRLRELGVVTVGYITVGEDDPREARKGDGTGPGGYASWYFDDDNDGQPDRNPIWHSYYTNANDPKWRADRVAEARRLVEEYGFDGIFLDTLDTATARPHTKPGMIRLVQELREALPDAPIILNQGFSMLPELAPLADGLMLESFTATYDFDSRSYMLNYPQSIDWHLKRVQSEILPVIEKHPLKVLVLDYAPENEVERIQEAANRAATFGFLFAAAPIFLDDVYQVQVTGRPDPKWLKKMTTPELLSFKLDKPANGFPAGTVLMPSSAFAGYTIAPVVDGIEDRSNLHWSKAAWASAEDGEAAWVEIRLPQARKGGRLRIDFEPSHPSQAFFIETCAGDSGDWAIAHNVSQNTARSVTVSLPTSAFHSIRIRQEPGAGGPARPDLMWIAQIYLLD